MIDAAKHRFAPTASTQDAYALFSCVKSHFKHADVDVIPVVGKAWQLQQVGTVQQDIQE